MRKSVVISHFGSQQKVADALTRAGFRISQRGVSGWPDPIPLDRAVIVAHITRRARKPLKLDLRAYRAPSA